jgi:hypothetical protein
MRRTASAAGPCEPSGLLPKTPGKPIIGAFDRPASRSVEETKIMAVRQPPHVSHARGTELVIEHIEKYWCPSLLSEDLLQVVSGSAGP